MNFILCRLDIFLDIFSDDNLTKRIETIRSGVFKYQLGLSQEALALLLQRVVDAQERFRSSPLAPVANDLEKEVVVSSVFGTNTIEGGELSEQETEEALFLTSKQVQNIQQKRAVNIRNAYDYIRDVSVHKGWQPSLDDVLQIHKLVYDGLESSNEQNHEQYAEQNVPGVLRDNPDGIVTRVGNVEHGGVYKPPQLGKDIKLLLESLIKWQAELADKSIPALIRAPLFHLYFELIHPFWDGNGRVGRVLEAGILYSEGFRYAPFAQANYYLRNIHQYFALFNGSRKAADKKRDFPNNEFVEFFLEGMLETINHLHNRVNRLIHIVLYEANLKRLHDDKGINDRQYAIVNAVLHNGSGMALNHLKKEPWYLALYSKLTDKTKSRDLSKLKELKLVVVDENGYLAPGFVEDF